MTKMTNTKKLARALEHLRAYTGTLVIYLSSLALTSTGAWMGYYAASTAVVTAGILTFIGILALEAFGKFEIFMEVCANPLLKQVPRDIIEQRAKRAFDHFILWHEKRGGEPSDKLQMRVFVNQRIPGGYAEIALFFKLNGLNYISCYRDRDLQKFLRAIVLPKGTSPRSYRVIRHVPPTSRCWPTEPIELKGKTTDLSNHIRLRITAEAATHHVAA